MEVSLKDHEIIVKCEINDYLLANLDTNGDG